MQKSPPIVLDASSSDLLNGIADLPATAGIFCLAVDGRVTYLSSAPNLQRRVARTIAKLGLSVLHQPDSSARHRITIRCWESKSKLHTSILAYDLAKEHFPEEYRKRVHLRLPWFVALLTRDAFPRLLLTNRIPTGCEPVIGPFASRDSAQLYEQEVQGAFSLRRCLDILMPQPDHPGCIYGEMNLCLRPCQCAVDSTRYLMEASAVSEFLRGNGSKMIRELTKDREQATAAMNFEGAARMHKRLEKLNSAKGARDPVVGPVDNFNGVALVRESKSNSVQVLPIVGGCWQNPFSVEEGTNIQETLHEALQDLCEPRDTLEDLALFARWYYSSWREGLWVPFTRIDDLPLRKIARTIKKLSAETGVAKRLPGSGAETETSTTACD